MTSVKEFYRKEFNEMTDLQKENNKLKEENKHYKQIAQYHGNMSVKYTNKCAKYKQALQQIDDLLHNSEQKYNCIDYETVIAIKEIIKNNLYKCNEVIN